MAENLELLAPYGGITRIRFKGSFSTATLLSRVEPLSQWLPRYFRQRNAVSDE